MSQFVLCLLALRFSMSGLAMEWNADFSRSPFAANDSFQGTSEAFLNPCSHGGDKALGITQDVFPGAGLAGFGVAGAGLVRSAISSLGRASVETVADENFVTLYHQGNLENGERGQTVLLHKLRFDDQQLGRERLSRAETIAHKNGSA